MDFSLTEVRELILGCSECPLSITRAERPVPGYGPPNAKIMIIGEAPGYWEELRGQPFVGAAGKFLTTLLSEIDINRREVYIANVVNCRPPDNRDPHPLEMEACRKWADLQIKTINPKVIIAAGRFSSKMFFPSGTITSLHGTARYTKDRVYMAMYHPAAAMHNPSIKNLITDDFQKLKNILIDLNI